MLVRGMQKFFLWSLVLSFASYPREWCADNDEDCGVSRSLVFENVSVCVCVQNV